MKWSLAVFFAVTSAAALAEPAAEHPACSDPWIEPSANSPATLRDIAASCADPASRELFYNRAYHADLVGDYEVVNLVQPFRQDDGTTHFHAYRMFIALSEALARSAWRDGDSQRVSWLNTAYERAIEIAELRLRGYDLQADRLEARAWN